MFGSKNRSRIAQILRQQEAMAAFGSYALRTNDIQNVLQEAVRLCAEGLEVSFCKICRYRSEFDDLVIETGYGWKEGVVGTVVSSVKDNSPQGRTFITRKPAICHDVRKPMEFKLPSFYAAYRIISTIDVVINGDDDVPYGILEIDSDIPRTFEESDINFLQGYANVLSEAIGRYNRTRLLKTTIEEMQRLVEEKDKLIEQKQVLAQELQHRVRNNLQLVYSMLEKQLNEMQDNDSRKGVRAIARRVTTLAQVYDHLLGSGISRTTDFGSYAAALCDSLIEIQAGEISGITLTCETESMLLDLDTVTALGIIVAELVTNSYDHAFSDGKGNIKVKVYNRPSNGSGNGSLVVSDDGIGFTPDPNSKRHGLGLITRLMDQIDGKSRVVSNNGTTWTIDFPIP